MSIEKMLVVSTSHITPGVAMALDLPDLSNLVIYPHGEYGWLMTVPGEDCEDHPQCLRDCLEQARCEGCEWLLLDQDGPVHGLLEEYEW